MTHIFQARGNDVSYDPDYFKPLFEAEDHHFWFVVRNQVVAGFLRQINRLNPSGNYIAEIGCGTGNVLRVIEKSCPESKVVGMDLYRTGLGFARQRVKCGLVQGDIHEISFGCKFEIIGLFDVLEHMKDDIEVLRKVNQLLAPGGTLLLTVPAFHSLWSYFDEASHHVSRYELSDLKEKLIESGYEVSFISYYMAMIYPLVWLTRRLFRSHIPVDALSERDIYEMAISELRVIPVVNPIIAFLLGLEARWLISEKRLPFGTSLLAVARKPTDE